MISSNHIVVQYILEICTLWLPSLLCPTHPLTLGKNLSIPCIYECLFFFTFFFLSWQRIHLQCKRPPFYSWVRKICWRRDRLPIPQYSWASLVAQLVKNPPAMWETLVWFLHWEDPLREGKGYPLQYSGGFPGGSVVKNPPARAGDAGDAGSIPGSRRSPGEGNGNPFQYTCLRIPWTEEPGGLHSMGSQRVGHDWVGAEIHCDHTECVFHKTT